VAAGGGQPSAAAHEAPAMGTKKKLPGTTENDGRAKHAWMGECAGAWVHPDSTFSGCRGCSNGCRCWAAHDAQLPYPCMPPLGRRSEACRNEVMLMQRLQHPNIVAYKDSFFANGRDNLCIVMTYCDGGDLGERLAAAKGALIKEDQIMHWFVQTALAIHYMHENKVLHRDIKAQNIFLLGNGRLVLGDLGISKVLDGTMQFASTQIGTP
jgi:serine/threonine protein kinase